MSRLRSASIRDSNTFLAAHNHDLGDEANPHELQEAADSENVIGMADIVRFSRDKKEHLDHIWTKRMQTCRRTKRPDDVISVYDVIKPVSDEEISNEQTHYAVVIDPKQGRVLWSVVYPVE